jgi:predicted dehydrogenase
MEEVKRSDVAGKVGVAIVGCGNIAGPYATSLSLFERAEILGVTDIDPERAAALAERVGCATYDSLDQLLADLAVELVVNLSSHHSHYAITGACLRAGKNVYSEKPLAMTAGEARELVELAASRGLRLGCSPFTFLGEAQQFAWRTVADGRLGRVRLVYAEVNWGRIESWHPDPASFYQVGPLFDVGVYPLTLLTAVFGPARKVLAYGSVLKEQRVSKRGEHFRVESPDFVTAMIELESGPLVRLTTNFYVSQEGKQRGIEFHGDYASLHLSDWQNPDGLVEFAEFGRPYQPVPFTPSEKMTWSRGVQEMVDAMLEDRPHRVTGEQAAHVVEILEATARSIELERSVEVTSSFAPPERLETMV